MNETYCEQMEHPGEFTLVDAEGCPTDDGRRLVQDLIARARSLETDFSALRAQMQEYEDYWRLQAVRWDAREDKRLLLFTPAFATNEPRVLVDKAIRAVTRERVAWRISVQASWAQEKRDATQGLERYLASAFWMGDAERLRHAMPPAQHSLAWMGAVRGVAILIPFVRASPRQRQGDEYGDTEPFLVRTPDPMQAVWEDGADGLSFFASQDSRRAREFQGRPELEGLIPKEGNVEVWNIWWTDEDGNVWNAATAGDAHFHVPPTNHTSRRRLRYLPVYVDTPFFGAPVEATIRQSDTLSVQYRYQGILESVKDTYAVKNAMNGYAMRLMKDAIYSTLAINDERPHTADELKDLHRGPTVLNLGPDGRAQYLAPPQLSESLVRWGQTLDRYAQSGGMPDAALAGVSEGMTGVAIQEAALQGDLRAGPLSDMLKRIYQGGGECFFNQHRALRRKVKISGPGAGRSLVVEEFDPSMLPPPGDYIIECIHTPTLVRDEYREAQTLATQRNAGRAFEAAADDFFKDPQREAALARQERMEMLPGIQYLLLANDARAKYPNRPDIVAHLMDLSKAEVQAAHGASNPPQTGVDPAAAPMPQLPGGPAPVSPVGNGRIDPNNPGDQSMLAQMGATYGGV